MENMNTEENSQVIVQESMPVSLINTSPEVDKLQAALAKAQGAIKNALKDSDNPYFKSKYADLAACWDVARETLSANGICVIQAPTFNQEKVGVVTRLGHSSGQWMECVLVLPTAKHDAQGIGSAITYARRYSLSAMVGIATEDDDGNSASGNEVSRERTTSAEHKKAATQVKTPMQVRDELKSKVVPFLDKADPEKTPNLKNFWMAFFGVTDARSLPREPEKFIPAYEVLVSVLPLQEDVSMTELAELVKNAIQNQSEVSHSV